MEESRRAEVLVVGAGPAGCATALALLAAGRSVTVIDRAAPAAVGWGEVLPPAAWPALEGLGLAGSFREQRHLPARIVRCRWGTGPAYEIDLALHPYGGGWHLDRGRFDAMLRDAVRARGGSVERGALRRVRRDDGQWLVSMGARFGPVRADVLVDASGRARAVARRLGAGRSALDALVGLVAVGPTVRAEGPVRVATVIEAADAGWWYAGRLPGGRVVAAFLTDPDLLPVGRDRLPRFFAAALARTALVAREWVEVAGPATLRVAPAGTGRLGCPAGPGWLAVGDAAMAFDPLSGHGIAAALDSGLRAGAVVDRMLSGDGGAHVDHARIADAAYRAQLRLRAHYYGQERRQTPFWQRRRPDP
jgi:flavin-dependent dehydrogenase